MGKKVADLTVVQGEGNTNSPPTRGAAQLIGQFEVPFMYEVWGDGLYVIEKAPPADDAPAPGIHVTPSFQRRAHIKLFAHEPVWIRRFGRALDTDEQLVELSYRDALSGELTTTWVSRSQIANRIQLVQLAKVGVPVNDGNVGLMLHYLDFALHINGNRLECVLVASRSGAYELKYIVEEQIGDRTIAKHRHGYGWLVGQRWIGPPGTNVASDPRQMHQQSKGFTVSGDREQWLAKWRDVNEQGPLVRWLNHTVFAAPLLRFVKQRSFIVHQWGNTSTGKSALAKFAMSAWGDPQALTANFNRTQKSFTELFNYVDDLPLLFDELQASINKEHTQIIYALTLERGRGRATREGGLQEEIKSWRSVIRTTGEEPLIGQGGAVDLGGQANRVIQIGVPLMDSHTASRIHQWLEERHYGHGGVIFLEKLREVLQFNNGIQALQAKFHEFHQSIIGHVHPSVHSRALSMAAVALAEYLAMRFFYDMDKEEAMSLALSDALVVASPLAEDEVHEPVHVQAAQLICDDFATHRKAWFDLTGGCLADEMAMRDGTWKQARGVITKEETWIVQSVANDLLKRAGLPPRRVWSDLRRHQMLFDGHSASTATFAVVRKFHSFRGKVYALCRHKCGPFVGSDNDEEEGEE